MAPQLNWSRLMKFCQVLTYIPCRGSAKYACKAAFSASTAERSGLYENDLLYENEKLANVTLMCAHLL